jgi:hypothetical protein
MQVASENRAVADAQREFTSTWRTNLLCTLAPKEKRQWEKTREPRSRTQPGQT